MSGSERGLLARSAAVGVAQGILVALSVQFTVTKAWPFTLPEVRSVWFSIAVVLPVVTVLVGLNRLNRVTATALAVMAILVGYTAWHVAANAVPELHPGPVGIGGEAIFVYLTATAIWVFVGTAFMQMRADGARWLGSWRFLCDFAWNNALFLGLASIYTGIFWLLLWLGAGLFAVIGVKIPVQFLGDRNVIIISTSTIAAFALALVQEQERTVALARTVVFVAARTLLPIAGAIAVVFVATLGVTGLQPIWATGWSTPLMLALQISIVGLLNAVVLWGEGAEPYPTWLRHALRVAVLTLPVYAVICAYSLWLRIDQHGWSVDRVLAAVIVMVVGLFAVGYAVAAIRLSGRWMIWLIPVNVGAGIAIICLSIALFSPILDPYRIAASDQVGRLLRQRVDAGKFDYAYLRFDLGRAGQEALARLKMADSHPQAEIIRRRAEIALVQTNRWQRTEDVPRTAEEFEASLIWHVSGTQSDRSFVEFLMRNRDIHPVSICLPTGRRCHVLSTDLNNDRTDEYVLIWEHDYRGPAVFQRTTDGWQHAGQLYRRRSTSIDETEFRASLNNGRFESLAPVWRNLKIGPVEFEFHKQ